MAHFLFGPQPTHSADRGSDRSTPPGLPLGGANDRRELWRVVVGLELRPEEMARYLEIKAIRSLDFDAPTSSGVSRAETGQGCQ